MTLTWLTMLGAAIGVAERSHFTLHVHHLPPPRGHVVNVSTIC